MKTRLAFVGLPGSGKSSVGRLLARRIGARFVDSDAAIERNLGESIRTFFGREGEPRFRELEAAVIDGLCADMSVDVLSTGGGTVLREDNRQKLADAFTVVYLSATPEELHRRLRHDTKRPLLQVRDPRGALRKLYEERDPLYREVADIVIETGRPAMPALVALVLTQLELSGLLHSTQGSEGPRPSEPGKPVEDR